MGVNHYHHDDAGAPVLSGQAGALIALLDAVLVNGYGSKAGLGWTIAFTAANKRVYRLNSVTQSGRYLRVDDTAAKYAVVNAYNAMTGIDTGTGGFPDTATPLYWYKSTTADAVAREWHMYGDEGFAYLFSKWGSTASHGEELFWFGDLSNCPATPGQVSTLAGNTNGASTTPSSVSQTPTLNGTVVQSSVYAIPAADGSLIPTNPRRASHYMAGANLGNGSLNITGSDEPNGAGLRLSEVVCVRDGGSQVATNWIMGQMPGLYTPWHTAAQTLHGTVYADLIDGGGRSYRAQRLIYSSGSPNSVACVFMDITGPWR